MITSCILPSTFGIVHGVGAFCVSTFVGFNSIMAFDVILPSKGTQFNKFTISILTLYILYLFSFKYRHEIMGNRGVSLVSEKHFLTD